MLIVRRWWMGVIVAAGLIWGLGVAMGADKTSGAADRQARMLEKHPEADTNQDGQISREEWQQFQQSKPGEGKGPGRSERKGLGGPTTQPACPLGGQGAGWPDAKMLLEKHPELDTNGDGKLSPEEMKAGREKFRPQMMQRHGSPAPVMDALIRNFDKIDADGNGQLSKEELIQAREKMMSGPLGPGDRPGGFGGPGAGRGEQRGPREGVPAEKLLEHHPEADTDKDGKLSDEEIKAFREKTREQHREKRPSRGQGGAKQ